MMPWVWLAFLSRMRWFDWDRNMFLRVVTVGFVSVVQWVQWLGLAMAIRVTYSVATWCFL